MPFTKTTISLPTESIKEMFGEDHAPPESVVRAKPDGEWRLDDPNGNWRFWRYDEE